MISYIIRRLLLLLPTAFLALSFLFLLFFVLPGDTATLLAGGANRNVSPEVVARVAERYHLNDSLFSQFWHYWARTFRWDLGTSYVNNRSVNDILKEKAPRSLRLAFWASMIDICVGISVGLISSVKRYSAHRQGHDVPHRCRVGAPGVRARVPAAVRVRGVPEQARLAAVGPPADLAARARQLVRLHHPHR